MFTALVVPFALLSSTLCLLPAATSGAEVAEAMAPSRSINTDNGDGNPDANNSNSETMPDGTNAANDKNEQGSGEKPNFVVDEKVGNDKFGGKNPEEEDGQAKTEVKMPLALARVKMPSMAATMKTVGNGIKIVIRKKRRRKTPRPPLSSLASTNLPPKTINDWNGIGSEGKNKKAEMEMPNAKETDISREEETTGKAGDKNKGDIETAEGENGTTAEQWHSMENMANLSEPKKPKNSKKEEEGKGERKSNSSNTVSTSPSSRGSEDYKDEGKTEKSELHMAANENAENDKKNGGEVKNAVDGQTEIGNNYVEGKREQNSTKKPSPTLELNGVIRSLQKMMRKSAKTNAEAKTETFHDNESDDKNQANLVLEKLVENEVQETEGTEKEQQRTMPTSTTTFESESTTQMPMPFDLKEADSGAGTSNLIGTPEPTASNKINVTKSGVALSALPKAKSAMRAVNDNKNVGNTGNGIHGKKVRDLVQEHAKHAAAKAGTITKKGKMPVEFNAAELDNPLLLPTAKNMPKEVQAELWRKMQLLIKNPKYQEEIRAKLEEWEKREKKLLGGGMQNKKGNGKNNANERNKQQNMKNPSTFPLIKNTVYQLAYNLQKEGCEVELTDEQLRNTFKLLMESEDGQGPNYPDWNWYRAAKVHMIWASTAWNGFYRCTCFFGSKKKPCKHAVMLMCADGFLEYPDDVVAEVIEKRRTRGRPRKARGGRALIRD